MRNVSTTCGGKGAPSPLLACQLQTSKSERIKANQVTRRARVAEEEAKQSEPSGKLTRQLAERARALAAKGRARE